MGVVNFSRGTFAIQITIPNSSLTKRRQAFVGYDGRSTSACTQASFLTLSNGQLYVNFANGTVAQYSGSSGDAYDELTPSTTPGDVVTTFSLSKTGTLLWSSPSLFNGGALFCVLPSGVILAIFQQGAQPSGCVFIDLTVAECKVYLSPCYHHLLLTRLQ